MKQVDLDLVALFVAVADAGSYTAAARRLGLPKSSVSRGIARLETQLGAQILHRTTRRLSLSTAGAAFHERVAPHVRALSEAATALPERDALPAGELRVTAPNDLGASVLGEVVAAFVARHAAVSVDLRLTNRHVDLVGEGFDLAIRAVSRAMADSSLVSRRLSPIALQLYASPAHVARRGMPRGLEEIAEHEGVVFRSMKGAHRQPGVPRVVADDFLFAREALRAGAGIGLLPTFLAWPDVAAGRLVALLPRHVVSGGSFVLLHPKTRHVPRKVTAFRDFLLEHVEAHPLAPR